MKTKRVKRIAAIIYALICVFSATVPVGAAYTKKIKNWNVEAASKHVTAKEKKPYTIMVYMNGSDLESEGGAATDDLTEMLDARFDSAAAHLVVLTGGSRRWMNDVVPAKENMLWEIEDGWFSEVTGIGEANMGNPGTLSSFIKFCMNNYPAQRYGLIMWDHGGGAIDGYGFDEKYIDGNLTLLDMRSAFRLAGLQDNKLAFLGFDSCLMATVEMAAIASDYADMLIASEDLEPGCGWNYDFLNIFSGGSIPDGAEVGRAVVDTYFDFYGDDTDEILTLSVIDLSKVKPVVTAMGDLMRLCSEGLADASSFKTLAGKRLRTKTFGEGSPRDNECDMVDIGDMADELSDLYPGETGKIISALKDCVLYNRHNGSVPLSGLSAYYIYGGRKLGGDALKTYTSLPVSTAYRSYQRNFYNALTNQSETPSDDAREITKIEYVLWKPGKHGVYQMTALKDGTGDNWPNFNGYPVCLFLVARTNRSRYYAIPAEVNGRDCDIIVVINDANPNGLIEGARNRTGTIIQKGYDPINAGDRITLYTAEMGVDVKRGGVSGASDASAASQALKWKKGAEFKMGEGEEALNLTWEKKPEGCVEGSRVTDAVGAVEWGWRMKSEGGGNNFG